MGKEKRPSIYVDRGTLGSSDELDEYGVWVKSEPHDLALDGIYTDETSVTGDMDFEVPDIDDLPDLEPPLMEFDSNDNSDTDTDTDADTDSDSDVFNFGDFGDVDTDIDVNIVEEPEESNDEFYEPIEEADLDILPEIDDEAGDEYTEVSMDDFIGIIDPGEEDSSEFSVDIGSEDDVFQDVDDDSALPLPSAQAMTSVVQEERSSSADLSTQLLMKIAEELSSIRSELSSLKKEFTGIKVAAASSEGEEGRIYGEDDEKIALTGDELNNILNTADFTEEAGADVTIELAENLSISSSENIEADLSLETIDPIIEPIEESEDLQSVDLQSLDLHSDDFQSIDFQSDDLQSVDLDLDDSGSIELSADDFEPDVSDVSLEADLQPVDLQSDIDSDLETLDELDITEEDIPDFAGEGIEELSEIREQGVEPMTFAPAPEDSDYLDEDPLSSDDIDDSFTLEEISLDSTEDFADISDLSEDPIDLSDAVIDEPDLSLEIQENPLEEPAMEDISIDLDLTELDSVELEPVELEPDFTDLESADLEPADLESADFESADFESADMTPIEFEPEELDTSDLDLGIESQEGGDTSLIPEGFVEDLEPADLQVEDLEPEEIEPEEIFFDEPQSTFDESEEEAIPSEELELIDVGELEEIEEADSFAETPMAPVAPVASPPAAAKTADTFAIPSHLKQELKTVLAYMDQLLEALPDDKIEEFAKSEYYDTYKKLFKELGLV